MQPPAAPCSQPAIARSGGGGCQGRARLPRHRDQRHGKEGEPGHHWALSWSHMNKEKEEKKENKKKKRKQEEKNLKKEKKGRKKNEEREKEKGL